MVSRKKQHPVPRPKEFQTAPFRALKGLAVSEADAPAAPARVEEPRHEPADNGVELFLQAVAGVRPLNAPVSKRAHQESGITKTKKPVQEVTIIEESAFLEEIVRLKLDTKFADSIPDDGELQALSGNRLRQVKNGVVTVDHQLDLHGLSKEEALDALTRFLGSARKRKQKAVLVITGKGLHSSDEPVLHQAVASWLRDTGKSMVLEFAPAPREMGGSGAYVVFLRPPADTGSPPESRMR